MKKPSLDTEFIRAASLAFFDGESAVEIERHALSNLEALVAAKPVSKHTIAAMLVRAYTDGIRDHCDQAEVAPWTYTASKYPFLIKP